MSCLCQACTGLQAKKNVVLKQPEAVSGKTLTAAALWSFRCALGLTLKGLWQSLWLQSQNQCSTTNCCVCSSLGLEDSPLLLPHSAQTPSGRSSDYCALQGVPQLHQV